MRDMNLNAEQSQMIAFQAVNYTYPGKTKIALERCSVQIPPGEFCLVAGASGSGKSTFLRAVCGLVPHMFGGTFSGSLTIGGLDIQQTQPSDLADLVGFVDQDPETQVVMNTVRSELTFPLERRGYHPLAIAREVEEVAAILGLEELLDRSTTTLSGGELQRVALAAAFIVKPAVLVLDEPAAQLDPIAAADLIWRLRSLHEEFGVTILLAEHRLERCLHAVDRVLVFSESHLVHDGDPDGFLGWARAHAQALLPPAAKLTKNLGLPSLPVTVREARSLLRKHGYLDDLSPLEQKRPSSKLVRSSKKQWFWSVKKKQPVATVLRCADLWYEPKQHRPILRGVHTEIAPGEIIALMGRNGAGKTTLLQHFAGVLQPTRGSITRSGRSAFLSQNPNDYFLYDQVQAQTTFAALRQWRLDDVHTEHPRDLSGGQRQRLALATIAGDERPELLCLDEPTRGFDAQAKEELAAWLAELKQKGSAIVVATHDTEFVAEFADRVVLLANGVIVADGDPYQVFADGRYFTTDTVRILSGQALTPAQGEHILLRRALQTADGEVAV